MAAISPEQMAAAEEILQKVRASWLQQPGVTAVDLGFKWTAGEMTDRLAIRVHVAEKKPLSELSEEERFPPEIEGLPVDVIEATYRIHSTPQAVPAAQAARGQRFDPVPLGVSVGNRFTSAGTLGARVIDLLSGRAMILSNWHILVGHEQAEAGLAIWQPGSLDAPPSPDNQIAELARWTLGPYDAAVAFITGQRQVQDSTVEGQTVDDVTEPRLGMTLRKSGRTTGLTRGFIDGVKMQVTLSYGDQGEHTMSRVCRIIPRPGSSEGQEISAGGDSGSVWVDEASGKAACLHFAGELGDNPEHALAHEMIPVLEALNVRFAAQINQPQPIRQVKKRSWWQRLLDFLRELFNL